MVGSPVQYDETIDTLGGFREKKKNDKVDANLWTYLSHTVKGAAGWAFEGTLCTNGHNQVSVNFAGKNEVLYGAAIVAHEVGHNLGMSHDFRYFKGENCDCKGIMSFCGYKRWIQKWSECSRNDFLAHYNRIGESNWCLESKLLLVASGSCSEFFRLGSKTFSEKYSNKLSMKALEG